MQSNCLTKKVLQKSERVMENIAEGYDLLITDYEKRMSAKYGSESFPFGRSVINELSASNFYWIENQQIHEGGNRLSLQDARIYEIHIHRARPAEI